MSRSIEAWKAAKLFFMLYTPGANPHLSGPVISVGSIQVSCFLHSASECVLARDRHILQLEIIVDLPFGFPINNIISISYSNFFFAGVAIISMQFLGM